MAVATTYAPLSEAEHSAQLRKAVIASTIGTTIEWYDFFLYGTAAGRQPEQIAEPGRNTRRSHQQRRIARLFRHESAQRDLQQQHELVARSRGTGR